MKSIINKHKHELYLIAAISILLIISFFVFIQNTFMIKYDFLQQHISFYREFYRLIDQGSLSWDWNFFLGSNVYGLKAYYFIGDVFAWIAYLLYKLCHNVTTPLLLVTIMKFYVGGFGFYQYLKALGIRPKLAIGFSLIYLSSGWVCIFMEQPMFISFYAWIPYILWGMENYLQQNKWLLFTSATAILISCQYYLMWPLCWLILLLWFIRLITNPTITTIKQGLIVSLKLFAYFMLGVLLSAFIWYPSIIALLANPRIGTSTSNYSYTIWTDNQLLQILQNFFIPVTVNQPSLYVDGPYFFYQMAIYSHSLCLLTLPITFKANLLKPYRYLIGLLFILLISPRIGLFFHFTYSMRYSVIISIAMIITSGLSLNYYLNETCDNLNRYRNSIAIWTLLLIIIILALAIVIPSINGVDFINTTQFINYCIVALCLIFECLALLKVTQISNYLLVIALSFQCISLLTISNYHLYEDNPANYQTITNNSKYESLLTQLKTMDDSFYRIIIDGIMVNGNLYLGYPSVMNYDSTFQYTLNDFLVINRKYPQVDWHFNLDDPNLFELLNVKYVITTPASDMNYWYYYGSSIYTDDQGYQIIKLNNKHNYLAKSLTQFKPIEQYLAYVETDKPMHEITADLSNYGLVKSNLVDELNTKYQASEPLYLNPTYISNTKVTFTFTTSTNQCLFTSIPYDFGWTIKDNGKEINFFSIQGGFLGIELPAGNHELELTYHVPGFKVSFIISTIALVTTCALIIIQHQKRNQIH